MGEPKKIEIVPLESEAAKLRRQIDAIALVLRRYDYEEIDATEAVTSIEDIIDHTQVVA